MSLITENEENSGNGALIIVPSPLAGEGSAGGSTISIG
jgi:hypothetical protein